MYKFHGLTFSKIGFEAGGKIRYRIQGEGVDEERTTPLDWKGFQPIAEEIAAEITGAESENLPSIPRNKQKRKVEYLGDNGRGGSWFVSKW